MIISPISDMDLIKETMTKPYIWPHIHDDDSDIETFEPVPPIAGWIQYLGVFNPDYCGFFIVTKKNCITSEIHTVLEKSCRGEFAVEAARLVIEWVFSNTPCTRLITEIPTGNIPAEKLAINAGMHLYGLNEDSFKIDNVIKSVKLYGITKR